MHHPFDHGLHGFRGSSAASGIHMPSRVIRDFFCAYFILFSLLLTFAGSQTITAGQPVTTHASTFGIGRLRQLDTYLSPLNYKGVAMLYLNDYERPTTLLHGNVRFHSSFQAALSSTEPRAENVNYLGADLSYAAAWLHLWKWPNRLSVAAGPQIGTTIGGLYNTRNGNNPAQAHIQAHLAAAAMISYTLNVKHYPITICDQLSVPLIGAMFTPQYGQSYYEIFSLGNTDHNVRATHPINAPCFNNRLYVDLPCRKSTLRIGYLIDIRQSHVNSLRSHAYTHAFLIGWVRTFCLIPPDK